MYSLFMLVMWILLQCISNPRDFVKYISGKMRLGRKEIIAQKLLLRVMIKKVFSRAHVCSLDEKPRNAHDQNEQKVDFKKTRHWTFFKNVSFYKKPLRSKQTSLFYRQFQTYTNHKKVTPLKLKRSHCTRRLFRKGFLK